MSLSATNPARQAAADLTLAKGNTLLEHHIGMAKMGMAPGDVNPKLIEAAQVVVRLSSFMFSRIY